MARNKLPVVWQSSYVLYQEIIKAHGVGRRFFRLKPLIEKLNWDKSYFHRRLRNLIKAGLVQAVPLREARARSHRRFWAMQMDKNEDFKVVNDPKPLAVPLKTGSMEPLLEGINKELSQATLDLTKIAHEVKAPPKKTTKSSPSKQGDLGQELLKLWLEGRLR